jgi:hypothetical protein
MTSKEKQIVRETIEEANKLLLIASALVAALAEIHGGKAPFGCMTPKQRHAAMASRFGLAKRTKKAYNKDKEKRRI